MRRGLFLGVFVLCLLFEQTAFASYPDYLGGNRNYLLCGGHMGVGYYVDKSSLVVQKYDPPTYRISVNVLSVDDADNGNTEPLRVSTCTAGIRGRCIAGARIRGSIYRRSAATPRRGMNSAGKWRSTSRTT